MHPSRTSALQRPNAPTIAYDDRGSGDAALLFTPGWCVSRKVFASVPELCARRHHVLSLDWRGHGDSDGATGDFGNADLVVDALDVVRATGVRCIIPVALSHSGWVALELRQRLGTAVPGIVLLDWLVAEPPESFIRSLRALQREDEWEATRDGLFSLWTHDVANPEIARFISRDMGSYDFAMWSRAGREIERAYAASGSPLRALEAASSTLPVMHVYAQPDDPDFLSTQQAYAREHPWFQVCKLTARSHVPMFEVPEEMARIISEFADRAVKAP